jgi:hypothetical protein
MRRGSLPRSGLESPTPKGRAHPFRARLHVFPSQDIRALHGTRRTDQQAHPQFPPRRPAPGLKRSVGFGRKDQGRLAVANACGQRGRVPPAPGRLPREREEAGRPTPPNRRPGALTAPVCSGAGARVWRGSRAACCGFAFSGEPGETRPIGLAGTGFFAGARKNWPGSWAARP